MEDRSSSQPQLLVQDLSAEEKAVWDSIDNDDASVNPLPSSSTQSPPYQRKRPLPSSSTTNASTAMSKKSQKRRIESKDNLRGQAVAQIVPFLKSRGCFIHPALEFRLDQNTGGVYAKKAIAVGELLIRIPQHLTIAPTYDYRKELVQQSPVTKYLEARKNKECRINVSAPRQQGKNLDIYEHFLDLSSFQKVLIRLLHEKHQQTNLDHKLEAGKNEAVEKGGAEQRGGEPKDDLKEGAACKSGNEPSNKTTTDFSFYLRGLPDTFTTPLWWTPELKERAAGTGLECFLRGDDTKKVYESKIKDILQHAAKELKWTTHEQQPESAFNRYIWASSVICTRGYHNKDKGCGGDDGDEDGDGPYLIPLIDQFNHDQINFCTRLKCAEGVFLQIADKAIQEGQQICTTYGQFSSLQLLHTYGFVDDAPSENGSNFVSLSAEQILIPCIDMLCEDEDMVPEAIADVRKRLQRLQLLRGEFRLTKLRTHASSHSHTHTLNAGQARCPSRSARAPYTLLPTGWGVGGFGEFNAEDLLVAISIGVYSVILEAIEARLQSYSGATGTAVRSSSAANGGGGDDDDGGAAFRSTSIDAADDLQQTTPSSSDAAFIQKQISKLVDCEKAILRLARDEMVTQMRNNLLSSASSMSLQQ
eukprot:jgi/Bigna1/69588/fgenesh1_pg.9_\